MKRKAIAMLMIASMTVALFAGCGSKSDESDSGKVKLTFLDKHPEDEYKGYFEEAIADFEKENPDIERHGNGVHIVGFGMQAEQAEPVFWQRGEIFRISSFVGAVNA